MKTLNIDSISSREQYDTVRSRMEELIKEATELGTLKPSANNEHTKEIARLAKLSAEYEDHYMD